LLVGTPAEGDAVVVISVGSLNPASRALASAASERAASWSDTFSLPLSRRPTRDEDAERRRPDPYDNDAGVKRAGRRAMKLGLPLLVRPAPARRWLVPRRGANDGLGVSLLRGIRPTICARVESLLSRLFAAADGPPPREKKDGKDTAQEPARLTVSEMRSVMPNTGRGLPDRGVWGAGEGESLRRSYGTWRRGSGS
jgi:hypothetical protein